MPFVKRTPPQLDAASTSEASTGQTGTERYDSDPSNEQTSYGITKRQKRKREDDLGTLRRDMTEMFGNLKSEISDLMNSFKSQQDKKLSLIQASVDYLTTNLAELKQSVEFFSEKYDEIHNKIGVLEQGYKEYRCVTQMLETKIENLEKQLRNTSIEIRNIPMKPQESKNDLVQIAINTGKALKIDIQKSDISDIFRIPSKNSTNKPIIAQLNTTLLKENILYGIKKFNKDNANNKLNTNHLQIEGQPRPVYISENLTQKMKKIYFLARDFGKQNNYNYCWISKGKVYMRKQEGFPLIKIESEDDLKNLSSQI
ncbi:tropomyosin-like [Colias croceus]|uniref:tropomyosin-like n=1 Tax=Colias crocea TaxID=72248 RepID=UPI001E27E901|nr:tropomyosin-like [Colias croceus]